MDTAGRLGILAGLLARGGGNTVGLLGVLQDSGLLCNHVLSMMHHHEGN